MEIYEHLAARLLHASRFHRRREYAIRLRHAFRWLGSPEDRAAMASIAASAAATIGQSHEARRLYRQASRLNGEKSWSAREIAFVYYGEATDSQLPPARRFAMMHAARKEAKRSLRLCEAEGRSVSVYAEALSCILKMPMGRLPQLVLQRPSNL